MDSPSAWADGESSLVDYVIEISNLDLVGDLVAITRVFEDEGDLLQ
jgi:hypothetical protein